METPLSSRRITRSMAKASAAAPDATSTAHPPRPALHDITNDSPIVGLAASGLRTPASTAAKARPTPGSGEALLRGQVKTLLQKVHHDASSSSSSCAAAAPPSPNILRIHALLGLARSPAHLLAPTPANTPHLTTAAPHAFTMTVPCVLEEELIPKLQVIADALPPPPAQAEENHLGECNRALVFDDSPGKSDLSNAASVVSSSSLAFQDSSSIDRSPDDDSSSAWSIQVNASSEKGDEDTFTDQEDPEEEEEEWLTEDDEDDECFDDLCEGMSKMSVFDDEEEEEDKKAVLPAFQGKHTRFIYDSEGEMEREDVAHVPVENCTMVLRGLPVPEGKHLRFNEVEEDEE
uniref:Uncharacterized protein n=1 Tax=Oryza meridionalis TaxID=40149 RepID=A0A0E0F137_9ORYZ